MRNQIGLLFGRGPLRALVSGSSLYQADIIRVAEQGRYLKAGGDRKPLTVEDQSTVLRRLVANRVFMTRSRREPIRPAAIQREYDLLQGQIPPEQSWQLALRRNQLSAAALRSAVVCNLRALVWIERQIADRIQVREDERLRYYQTHGNAFYEPVRFRVSHLFLAGGVCPATLKPSNFLNFGIAPDPF